VNLCVGVVQIKRMNRFCIALVAIAACVCGCLAEYKFGQCEQGHPIIMIPGIYGTILNIVADIPESVPVHWYCKRQLTERRIWINAAMELQYPCFYTYMGQNFSVDEMKWKKTEGVNLTVAKWGTTYAVDTLDPDGLMKYAIPYYHKMIEAFKKVGYVDGVNMAGGGFHWIDAPNVEWVERMKKLIEDFYEKNGNTVVLVAHSMGCPYTYYFLQTAGDAWVKKYIHKLIVVSPAWMGSVKALDFMFDGFDYGVPIAGKVLAPLARHVPSVWMLLPWADAFKGKIMATSPSKNYTFDMLAELLKDVGADNVDAKLKTTMGVFDKFDNYAKPPPVPVIALLGRNVDTVTQLNFKKDVVPCDPDGTWTADSRTLGDGDGTVPADSLRYPTDKWAAMGADVQVHYFDKAEHVKILYTDEVINMVVNEAC